MSKAHLVIGFVGAVLLWLSPAFSDSAPRACFDWHRDPKGPLPRQDVDSVLYRQILFKRAGQNYDVETFSDMSAAGADHCFRWEIVNSSRSNELIIDRLTWPAAGIRVDHMRPGEENRDYNNRRDRIEPQNASNPVHAFEHEQTPTQSWVVQAASKAAGTSPDYHSIKTKELLPALRLETADVSIYDTIVTVISFGSGREPPPEILQVVGYGGLAIRVTSNVTPQNNTLLIATNAEVANPPNPEMLLNFPALTALQRTGPQRIGDPGEATRFIANFREAVTSRGEGRAAWNFSSRVPVTPGGNVDVYRIRQPVVVSVGQERHCYLVATYSPIPVSFSLDNCW